MELDAKQTKSACLLLAAGQSHRQIAARLDTLPTAIKALAEEHNLGQPRSIDWAAVRMLYMRGWELMEIHRQTGISYSTLRKRRKAENWQRYGHVGLGAMRSAVTALEAAIMHTAPDDSVQLARIANALSLAGYRLGRAEKALPDTPRPPVMGQVLDAETGELTSGESDQWYDSLGTFLGWE